MGYIIGLFLILAIIFSSIGGGSNLLGNFLGQVKDKITATIFPKTEKEIIIDNLNSNNQSLDKFFSETAPIILNSKSVSESDKTAVKKAMESFKTSKTLISNLSKLESKEKTSLKKATNLIEKVLNLAGNSSNSSDSSDSSVSNSISPTNIPPQCHLECTK